MRNQLTNVHLSGKFGPEITVKNKFKKSSERAEIPTQELHG
jgi:hypothetical protein